MTFSQWRIKFTAMFKVVYYRGWLQHGAELLVATLPKADCQM